MGLVEMGVGIRKYPQNPEALNSRPEVYAEMKYMYYGNACHSICKYSKFWDRKVSKSNADPDKRAI